MIVFTLINIDVALFKPWTGGPYHGCVFQLFIREVRELSSTRLERGPSLEERKRRSAKSSCTTNKAAKCFKTLHHTNICRNLRLVVSFQPITFKLGNLIDLKEFSAEVLKDFPLLVPVKG